MEGRGLHVTHVALDAGDAERSLATRTTERFADRVPFDAVADYRAGRVGFDVVEIARGDTGSHARSAHQLDLRMARRGGDVAALGESRTAVGRASRVHGRGVHQRVDAVSVSLGSCQRLEGEDERPFRANVPVGVGVEGMTLAVRADDAKGVEGGAEPGGSQIVDGADDGLLAVTVLQGRHRCVHGGEARRTCRAVGRRRPHQVEVVRDPIREHSQADARDVEGTAALHRTPAGNGGNLRTHEDAGRTVANRFEAPSDALEGLPGAREQHPDLRVGHLCLAVRHSEQAAVEQSFAIVPDQALPGAGEAPGTRESADRLVASAIAVCDGLLDDLAFA